MKCGHCICLCCRKKKEEAGMRKKWSFPSWINLLQSIFLENIQKDFCLVIPRESEECSVLAEVNNSFLWSTKQNIKLLLFLLQNRKKKLWKTTLSLSWDLSCPWTSHVPISHTYPVLGWGKAKKWGDIQRRTQGSQGYFRHTYLKIKKLFLHSNMVALTIWKY